MRRSILLVICVLSVALAGCRKKNSLEFIKANDQYHTLVNEEGDDAYTDEKMNEVRTLLQAVNPESKQAAEAAALLATIASETARVNAAIKAEQDKAAAEAAAIAAMSNTFPSGGSADPGTAQAGTAAAAPTLEQVPTGMPEADFKAKYAGCFSDGPATLPPGASGKPTSQKLIDSEACHKRFGGAMGTQTLFCFVDGKYVGQLRLSESKTTTTSVTYLDAGVRVVPPAASPVPVIPGMPMPQGYQVNGNGAPPEAPPAEPVSIP